MTSAPAQTTTTLDRVEIVTLSAARASLRDGSLFVHASSTSEIVYTVRRLPDPRDAEVLVRPVDGGRWHELDPAWELPATIIYTPQN